MTPAELFDSIYDRDQNLDYAKRSLAIALRLLSGGGNVTRDQCLETFRALGAIDTLTCTANASFTFEPLDVPTLDQFRTLVADGGEIIGRIIYARKNPTDPVKNPADPIPVDYVGQEAAFGAPEMPADADLRAALRTLEALTASLGANIDGKPSVARAISIVASTMLETYLDEKERADEGVFPSLDRMMQVGPESHSEALIMQMLTVVTTHPNYSHMTWGEAYNAMIAGTGKFTLAGAAAPIETANV